MFKKKAKEEEQKNDTPIYESTARKRAKLIIKIAVPVVLVAIFAFIIFRVATSEGRQVVFSKDGVSGNLEVSSTLTSKGVNGIILSDQGMTVVAENDDLMLSFSNKENLFIVTDKKTGETFRSYPEAIYETTLGENEVSDLNIYDKTSETGQFITSPVFVGYTKSGMDGGFVLGVNQMKHTKTVYFIENGVRLRYEMLELELEFSVEITIEGNELVYRIPKNGIIEREGLEGEEQDRRPLLASLSVLPYLGSHRSGQEGCFVTPDGTGALTYFDTARITNYNEYSKKVYGSDLTFDTTDKPVFGDNVLTIGAYGIIENFDEEGSNINKAANSMMTSFIAEGDSNAELKIANPGIRNLPFYSIYFQYNYRDYYKLQISDGGTQYDMIVKDMQLGDVEQRIRISVSAEDDYSYVDTAKIIRENLLKQWKNRYGIDLKSGDAGNAATLNLKMFMGASNVSGGVLDQVKVMTDFEDVKNIYGQLKELAPNLRLSLLGWQKGGYYWNATSKLKVDSAFGGKDGLIELNKWAKEQGIQLSLDNNTLVVYGSPVNGASFRDSIVKQANTFYLNYFINDTSGVYRKTDFYVMGPSYYNTDVLSETIENLKKYNASGVDLRHLGDMLYSDYNEENPLFRVQTMNLYTKWLQEYGKNFENVAVYTGNAYAIPFVDTVMDMPIEKSYHIVLDEDIPLTQIIYHGFVDYYSAPINNQDNEEFYLLRSIEYGSLLSYEVTEEKTSDLRYTYYNGLYRSEFANLKDEIVARYNAINEAVKDYSSLEIVNHYRVDDNYDVFCTEYSDGTCVYVCYETEGVELTDSVNGQELSFSRRGYEIKKGGE